MSIHFGGPGDEAPNQSKIDAGRLVRLCAEQTNRTKERHFIYKFYGGTEPIQSVIPLIKRHPTIRDSYSSSLRSGESVVHNLFSFPVQGASPFPTDIKTRLLHSDSCIVGAYALYDKLQRSFYDDNKILAMSSRSKGNMTLNGNTLRIMSSLPVIGTYSNPLLSLHNQDGSGNMISLTTPDNTLTGQRASHVWVRCGARSSTGEALTVNLDPTITQYEVNLPYVWFGDDLTDQGRLRLGHQTVLDPSPSQRDKFLNMDVSEYTCGHDWFRDMKSALDRA